MPDPAMLAAMGRYNEKLAKAGVMPAGEGPHPSRRGKRVRFAGEGRCDRVAGPVGSTRWSPTVRTCATAGFHQVGRNMSWLM